MGSKLRKLRKDAGFTGYEYRRDVRRAAKQKGVVRITGPEPQKSRLAQAIAESTDKVIIAIDSPGGRVPAEPRVYESRSMERQVGGRKVAPAPSALENDLAFHRLRLQAEAPSAAALIAQYGDPGRVAAAQERDAQLFALQRLIGQEPAAKALPVLVEYSQSVDAHVGDVIDSAIRQLRRGEVPSLLREIVPEPREPAMRPAPRRMPTLATIALLSMFSGLAVPSREKP